MVSLTDIGRYAFSFSLITAVISTVIALALVSAGVPPSTFNVPIFIGMRGFYNMTYNMYQSMPTNSTDVSTFMWSSATILAGSLVQFILTMLGATFLLINSIAVVLPPEVSFLITPLYFVGGFIQVTAWIYLVSTIRDIFSGLLG